MGTHPDGFGDEHILDVAGNMSDDDISGQVSEPSRGIGAAISFIAQLVQPTGAFLITPPSRFQEDVWLILP